MKKSTKRFSSITAILLVLALVVMVVGFVVVFTDGFTTTLKEFYVKCSDDVIVGDRDNFSIVIGEEYRFEICNTYADKNNDYTISITPNYTSSTAFSFNVDGKEVNFADVKSLAKGFSISANSNYFTLTANKDLADILQLYYPNKTITNVPTAIDSGCAYFKLTISAQDMVNVININFNLISER